MQFPVDHGLVVVDPRSRHDNKSMIDGSRRRSGRRGGGDGHAPALAIVQVTA
jgi:hypothetical protein